MTLLWESDAMIAATSGRPVGPMPEGVSGISIDTRTLQPGDAYFAIKGDRVDGHDFVSAAMKAGAALAVVSEEKLVALGGLNLPFIVVSDVLKAMELLGEASRARTKARIVAVTGSVGKTTTKEMLATILSASGRVHASVASYNNHWGVPLTLARMPAESRFGVFEIGMNHPDEIRPLVKMVRPHVALITNVAAVHLGAFDSVDGIAHAKAEIFEGLVEGGYGLLNRDDKRYKLLRELAEATGVSQLKSFGTKRGSDYRLISSELEADGSQYTVSIGGEKYHGRLNVAGKHMLPNVLASLAAAHLLGADIECSVNASSQILAVKGRGLRHKLHIDDRHISLIDESYNANPSSMRAALSTLAATLPGKEGRRIAVLGDMLELGKQSEKMHREIAEVVKKQGIDRVFAVGQEMAVLEEELRPDVFAGHFDDWQAAEQKIVDELKSGDVIMLKSSLGIRFVDLVAKLVEKYAVETAS